MKHTPQQHPSHGREVLEIFWPASDGEVVRLKSHNGIQLRFHSEFLGDHTENWILVLVGEKEVQRHNTRFLETIIWIED